MFDLKDKVTVLMYKAATTTVHYILHGIALGSHIMKNVNKNFVQ